MHNNAWSKMRAFNTQVSGLGGATFVLALIGMHGARSESACCLLLFLMMMLLVTMIYRPSQSLGPWPANRRLSCRALPICSLCFHCHSPPFLVFSLPFTAVPCVFTAFHRLPLCVFPAIHRLSGAADHRSHRGLLCAVLHVLGPEVGPRPLGCRREEGNARRCHHHHHHRRHGSVIRWPRAQAVSCRWSTRTVRRARELRAR